MSNMYCTLKPCEIYSLPEDRWKKLLIKELFKIKKIDCSIIRAGKIDFMLYEKEYVLLDTPEKRKQYRAVFKKYKQRKGIE